MFQAITRDKGLLPAQGAAIRGEVTMTSCKAAEQRRFPSVPQQMLITSQVLSSTGRAWAPGGTDKNWSPCTQVGDRHNQSPCTQVKSEGTGQGQRDGGRPVKVPDKKGEPPVTS